VSSKNFDPLLAPTSGGISVRRPTSLGENNNTNTETTYPYRQTSSGGKRQFPSSATLLTGEPLRGVSTSPSAFEQQEPSSGHSVSAYAGRLNTYLPGDKIMFREGKTSQVFYRTADERSSNPERLNLDRRGLTACPTLESEDQLRLLNFQHNAIRVVENVDCLRRLIFLDFYDNQLEQIDGLSALRSLRVLMLGKNRIKRIENLETLTKLDVLDLHGNQIRVVEGLQHLSDLRVLNLASNCVEHVRNLTGLSSLVELNLRRNRIHTASDIDTLPNIQRLFLSFNNITSFEDVSCIGGAVSLSELALDGNPISHELSYKQTVLRHVTQIRQLDMKRVTDEERRIATVMGRKEDEKKRESSKMAAITERRRKAISTVRRQWEATMAASKRRNKASSSSTELFSSANFPNVKTPPPRDSSSPDSGRLSVNSDVDWANSAAVIEHEARPSSIGSAATPAEDTAQCADSSQNAAAESLSEIEGDTLQLYGSRSLDAFDRSWGFQAAGCVNTVHFHYVDFDEIAKVLGKIRVRFPNVVSLIFTSTNIRTLTQLNALTSLRRLDNLTISGDGNPVTRLSVWRPYVVFRLAHFSLKHINNSEVAVSDVVNAEKCFSTLASVITSKIPQSRLAVLLGDRKKQLLSDDRARRVTSNESIKIFSSASDKPENIGRAVLTYSASATSLHDRHSHTAHVRGLLRSVTKEAVVASQRRATLASDWSAILSQLVRDAIMEIRDTHDYAKGCYLEETQTQPTTNPDSFRDI